ncbi:MAG: insulinase family protein [Peptococcaceae bacterium]|nr:insulinase family protein [Peptococcaceae bacterium]
MIHKTILSNGIKILTEEIPHVRSVALGIWVDLGSRYEKQNVAGISHFIEHMMFKGTPRRTAQVIAEELDAVGGQLNAFTTKEYTCYYAKTLDEHFPLAADILTDMIFNSRFAQEDIDRERNVILEEIKMYEDTPDELVHDLLARAVWDGHPLGHPVIGNAQVIEDLSRESLLSYYEKFYRRGHMVIAVAGNIRHEQVLEQLAPIFETCITDGTQSRVLVSPPPKLSQTNFQQKDTEQVHLCIGGPGLALSDERIYAMQVLNTVLGGGLSSRLFQKIREQYGLVYNVFSYHSSYHDTGIFGIYAGLSPRNAEEVLNLTLAEVKTICDQGIPEEELSRAKNQIKGNFLLSLEGVNTRMSRLGKSELYLNQVLSPDEIVHRLEQVTSEDIKMLARVLFVKDGLCLASIGPWDDTDSWNHALTAL